MAIHDMPLQEPPTPRLALRRADQQALLAIAYRGLLSDTRSAAALLHEASRAELLADDEDPPQTVTLWSRVSYRDDGSGARHTVRLVPPDHPHGDASDASVLSPLGAALVGLSAGQAISCPDRRGGRLRLTVLQVSPPIDECGDTR